MRKVPRGSSLAKRRRFWAAHIEAWRQSNLSQAEYCRQQGLPIKSFVYWKGKSVKERTVFPECSLVEVPVRLTTGSLPGAAPLKLFIDDRFRIEIPEDFSPVVLGRLIDTLSHLR